MVNKVRVWVRVNVRIRVSLVSVTGWGWWSEQSYMSGCRRVDTALTKCTNRNPDTYPNIPNVNQLDSGQ